MSSKAPPTKGAKPEAAAARPGAVPVANAGVAAGALLMHASPLTLVSCSRAARKTHACASHAPGSRLHF